MKINETVNAAPDSLARRRVFTDLVEPDIHPEERLRIAWSRRPTSMFRPMRTGVLKRWSPIWPSTWWTAGMT